MDVGEAAEWGVEAVAVEGAVPVAATCPSAAQSGLDLKVGALR